MIAVKAFPPSSCPICNGTGLGNSSWGYGTPLCRLCRGYQIVTQIFLRKEFVDGYSEEFEIRPGRVTTDMLVDEILTKQIGGTGCTLEILKMK